MDSNADPIKKLYNEYASGLLSLEDFAEIAKAVDSPLVQAAVQILLEEFAATETTKRAMAEVILAKLSAKDAEIAELKRLMAAYAKHVEHLEGSDCIFPSELLLSVDADAVQKIVEESK